MADRAEKGGAYSPALPQTTHSSEPSTLPTKGTIRNKVLEQVIRTPNRLPSPQPTHLGVPGSNQQRTLQEHGSGYVAPKFEGKESQMEQGELKKPQSGMPIRTD